MEALKITGLSKIFGSGRMEVRALEDISLAVSPGELVALMGPSGSGKTTLLLCVSLILEPTTGTVVFDGDTIYQDGWTGFDVRRLRREKIGFVFQSANLIPFLTARENVLFPFLVGVKARRQKTELRTTEYMEIADGLIICRPCFPGAMAVATPGPWPAG
jgi:putative ABC transport system ATP-binding protein